ncbi:hypothetical protein B0I35DRAFT_419678 [Stachybotrys elegans]|uniref:Secreted protein n=1 Tax=Stachybotrys elegans TaxID=80388 RepID=A0A8K0T5K3_9HYPO|nr:hypothetical protein B0I35DRAFT_419678 [Stachybotrys elegans]
MPRCFALLCLRLLLRSLMHTSSHMISDVARPNRPCPHHKMGELYPARIRRAPLVNPVLSVLWRMYYRHDYGGMMQNAPGEDE